MKMALDAVGSEMRRRARAAGMAERETRDVAGFTLIELVLAMALLVIVLAGLVGASAPIRRAAAVLPVVVDVQQRLRVAVDRLHRDLSMAGAGLGAGRAGGPLHGHVAAVIPYRLDAGGGDTVPRANVISTSHVPHAGRWAVFDEPFSSGAPWHLRHGPGCRPGQDRCGVRAGSSLLVFNRGGEAQYLSEAEAMEALSSATFSSDDPAHPPRPLVIVSEIESVSYYTEVDGEDGVAKVMRKPFGRRAAPLIDAAAAIEFEYFGEPVPPLVVVRDGALASTYGPAPPRLGEQQSGAYPPGENCTFARDGPRGAPVPRLVNLAGRADPYVPLDLASFGDGPWCPHAANPFRFDADVLRIRQVRVTLRVQGGLEPPAVPLPGQRPREDEDDEGRGRWSEVEVRIDVFPRNLGLE